MMRRLLAAFIGLTCLFGAATPSSSAQKSPEFFRFVATLCGKGSAVQKKVSSSFAACVGNGIDLQLLLDDRAERLISAGKPRAKEQNDSCVFELERTTTTSLGVTPDATYVGAGSRLSLAMSKSPDSSGRCYTYVFVSVAKCCAGVSNPSVFRGRLFSSVATDAKCALE
jgi:hypothetical protein